MKFDAFSVQELSYRPHPHRDSKINKYLESFDISCYDSVYIPMSILKQLEVVKYQLTEFQILLDLNEQKIKENEIFEERVEEIQEINKFAKREYNFNLAEQEQLAQNIEKNLKEMEEKKIELKRKLANNRRLMEENKRQREKDLIELALLRQIHNLEKEERGKKKKPSARKSFTAFETSRAKTSVFRPEKELNLDDYSVSSKSTNRARKRNFKKTGKDLCDINELKSFNFDKEYNKFSLSKLKAKSKKVFNVLSGFAEESNFSIIGHNSTDW